MAIKKLFLSLFLLTGFVSLSPAGTIVIEGNFLGRSLYIQNGFAGSGVGFCSYMVRINGRVCTDEINSSAYEVDFSQFDIAMGTAVTVEIKHKDDCKPMVLNPDALKPKPTFDIEYMSINANGILNWKTNHEQGSLPFVVEQFRWNKWVTIGEVAGIGTPDAHEYSFKVTPHSGANRFRIRQTGFTGKTRFSEEVVYNSILPQLTFTSSKGYRSIFFSGETMFEIYDLYGNVVKRGFGKDVDIVNLKRGSYYLCYDNTMTTIQKR
jgi:hypothetical protein